MADPTADTIAAIATPPGRGGVGIVRISGRDVPSIAAALTGHLPPTRVATLTHFRDAGGLSIDHGIALYFRAPASFTGEDVLELQGHGGPIVMDMLLSRIIALGARLAEPGEFSRRAFLNGKLDLAQAEAIADLIDSQTQAAARSAMRTLDGAFSTRVHSLIDAITRLRVHVEAAIDFPEEEIDFLADDTIGVRLNAVIDDFDEVLRHARTGRVLRDGMTLVIAGLPNSGKSSLMNVLTGQDSAIVTHIAGTTRDVLREHIDIDGLPVTLIDTAGLRESDDAVEREGVRRARVQIARADHALWVFDGATDHDAAGLMDADLPPALPVTLVRNKADISGVAPAIGSFAGMVEISLSAKTGAGVELLRDHLKQQMAYAGPGDGDFSARRRHIDALECARVALRAGQAALFRGRAGELLAEDLRQAQHALSSITGEFSADDLLGEIFSSFCIGK
ncbi:MAG: tRNA uridine-5-carboxymethylaminomethyl(34) synthesis GTPase MnmE [Chromatiaceae bacterium]|nr:tRNA uridine-5-carboxymethylaminomethyl(34) synthesis GTPase MnmE [Gammaproteobacteria bacterium]MCP5300615.1 tRNA uridine-5-carboxymethylaminomethyl(34) synthesis GTPase MnmE [Chromatiaceae bacterium]MCP5422687.1 tRNA uridine-5-carboxymethylaminomethyl(34) synthesis GTPase MnmE [Chromatiaceae bacterium]